MPQQLLANETKRNPEGLVSSIFPHLPSIPTQSLLLSQMKFKYSILKEQKHK